MPEHRIDNGMGRLEFNPWYGRVRAVLERIQARVHDAVNPRAYEQAVLRAEFPQFVYGEA